ncbi:hypothetical protein [Pseudanabaena sp. FACHB-2040]|uniref:hypothetical protein n=1 Tax=Pseudanabaena sp. FACHB-2040 TaxID=2692859 RepID=UPI001685F9C3|nr:hypothetical protein [Pseudanabaena sp. FACHB-2040]MBD2261081.1 hypothetical protein [Pseudanabaena sp. FACHB-2040]
MGEMYEYFQDFPEEDPANYVGDRFNPEGAKRLRAEKAKLEQEQAALDAEIRSIIEKARQSAKQNKREG